MGAQFNAFTREDETTYHALLPREELGRYLAMEADRMGNLQLSDAMLASEREVVKEEYRLRIQNQPMSAVYEAYLRRAFTLHPYAFTPAGTLEDLERITLADCLDFYRTYYAPNNAVLAVVGDTSLREVAALAEKSFGPLKRQKAPPAVTAVEPQQTQRRDLSLTLDVQMPILVGGFHVPPVTHPDADALTVLSSILSEGESSGSTSRWCASSGSPPSPPAPSSPCAIRGCSSCSPATCRRTPPSRWRRRCCASWWRCARTACSTRRWPRQRARPSPPGPSSCSRRCSARCASPARRSSRAATPATSRS